MKNSNSKHSKAFKGQGYLIGAILGIIAAVSVFVFTENMAIAIPLFAGLSIPVGMSIEQKLQTENEKKDPNTMKIMITLIAIGILCFFSIIFLS
jgi:predicted permease